MRVQIADDEAAAVEKHQRRQVLLERRPIHPDRNLLHRPGDDARVDLRDGLFRTAEIDHVVRYLARFIERQLFERGPAGHRQHVQKRFALWMECHGASLYTETDLNMIWKL